MSNKQWIKTVETMTRDELFAVVMACPEWLTDGYYRDLGDALRARYGQLTAKSPSSSQRRPNHEN